MVRVLSDLLPGSFKGLMAVLLASAVFLATNGASADHGPPVSPSLTSQYNSPGTKSAGAENLAVLVHGWTSNPTIWANDFSTKLGTALTALGTRDDWDIWVLDWREDAAAADGTVSSTEISPSRNTEVLAEMQGHYLAKHIASQTGNYDHVHLFGHSLGGRVVESAAVQIDQFADRPDLHMTFFDAYTPYTWDYHYGEHADWADHIIRSADYPRTNDFFPHALNVNVNAFDPSGITELSKRHNYPHQWYRDTITGFNQTDPDSVMHGYGFPQSLESGGSPTPVPAQGRHVTLTADAATRNSRTSVSIENEFSIGNIQDRIHEVGTEDQVVTATADTLELLTVTDFVGKAWAHLQISVGSSFSQTLNFFEFEYRFLGDSVGAGPDSLLSAFWNGEHIWSHRESLALDGWQSTGKLSYPRGASDVFGGKQTFSFLLDVPDGYGAVQIRNIHGGRLVTMTIAVPEPGTFLLLAVAAVCMLRRRKAALPRRRGSLQFASCAGEAAAVTCYYGMLLVQ